MLSSSLPPIAAENTLEYSPIWLQKAYGYPIYSFVFTSDAIKALYEAEEDFLMSLKNL